MGGIIPRDGHVMIIGAMKCGTTALFSYLGDHPQICPARKKETEFFSSQKSCVVKTDIYEDLFLFDSDRHQYALESSINYTKFPEHAGVPKKIFDYGIQPKFIYLVRNPFDRIESHYNYMRYITYGEWKLKINDSHLINISNYYLQLEQYRKLFPIKDMLILDLDEMKQNLIFTLKKVYQFLGVSQDCLPSSFAPINALPQFSNLEIQLRRPGIKGFLRYTPKWLKKAGESVMRGLSNSGIQALTADEKSFVYSSLRDDMKKLQTNYGVDVQRWGF